jgi:catechol 2,3-dioxygenase-like lactoylglutathione lyase family enzyme
MPDSPPGQPERLRFISGVILVSSQPARLTEFYRDVLGFPLAEERHGETEPHWGCELGDVHFAIHPAEDYPEDPASSPSPVKLAFMVFDLPRMVEWLDRCEIPLCYPPAELGEESWVAAVRDPDGNLVELTQLGPGWLSHLKAQRADGNDLVSAWDTRLARLAGSHARAPASIALRIEIGCRGEVTTVSWHRRGPRAACARRLRASRGSRTRRRRSRRGGLGKRSAAGQAAWPSPPRSAR